MQKNINLTRLFLSAALLLIACFQFSAAFGREDKGVESEISAPTLQQTIIKTRGTVDKFDSVSHRAVIDDQYVDLPAGTPHLRSGDVIEMEVDKKTGKILKVTRAGVRKQRKIPGATAGGLDGKNDSSDFSHGKIHKVNGRWQNY